MINNNLNGIYKKHNQTSASDADQEIPTLGSTDNAENSEQDNGGKVVL